MNKRNSKSLVILTLMTLTLLFSSCRDDFDNLLLDSNNMVTFTFRVPGVYTPSSRALTTSDESAIDKIDILLFNPSGGVFNYHATGNAVTIDDNRMGSIRIKLPEDTFDMVLIANARDEVTAAIADLSPTFTMGELQAKLTFDQAGKWPAGSPNYRPFPMWAEVMDVNTSGSASITGVNLIRAVARINVEVTAANFKLTEVNLYHPVTEGYIIPLAENMDSSLPRVKKPTINPAWSRSTGSLIYKINNQEMTSTECKNEIYTFEAPFGDGTYTSGIDMSDGNTFLVIGGQFGEDTEPTFYRIDIATQDDNRETTYLPLLRNHRYEVVIKGVTRRGAADATTAATLKPVNIISELVVVNEGDMQYHIYDDQYFIGIDNCEFEYESGNKEYSFDIRTDYPFGWKAVASADPDDPEAPISWLSVNTETGSIGTSALSLSLTRNEETSIRKGYIHILAGDRLKAVVEINQMVSLSNITLTPINLGYVGAFWRPDQTGERLIRILNKAGNNIAGNWTATVISGKDWIILDTEQSQDDGITWNRLTENPADMFTSEIDTRYRVTGDATTVSGTCAYDATGEIYFRIGLKNKYTPTENEPARYGVVLLRYRDNNNYTLVFVRQGHDADYLMRPQDPSGNGNLPVGGNGIYRPLAAKISPFNLTADAYRDHETYLVSFVLLPFKDEALGISGGVFTDFPSQAGAYFKFAFTANLYIRAAWNSYMSSVTFDSGSSNGFWSSFTGGDTQETCPPGYRRFSDGSTSAVSDGTIQSEVRQSLWLNPQAGSTSNTENVLHGYYADGWFDRQEIVTVGSGTDDNAVSINTTGVSYRGTLFYNPDNNASIFFPWAGFRQSTDGINWVGDIGIYWSSSAQSESSGWYMGIAPTDARMSNLTNRGLATSIRCVKE